jgi:hypothetical protein
VTDGFAVLDRLTPFEVQGPGLARYGAELATVRAGLLVTEGVGLLLQEDGEGALGQALCRLLGHLLQGAEVDRQRRAFRAESAAGHDFTPGGRQVTDVPEVFGLESGTRHGLSCLVLGRSNADAVFFPFYAKQPFAAKQVLTSDRSLCAHFLPHPVLLP